MVATPRTPFTDSGREVVVVDATRTPIGRSHSERGAFREQSRNIARNAWLQAGYPVEVPAITIDRRCGSGQSAVAYAAALVASGTHELVIASGVEHMHHVPIDSPLKLVELFGTPWPQELLDR